MKHWVGHIWRIGYTTYGALEILHMKHWVDRIEYTTYDALDRPHMGHWIGHIWGTGYITYGALDISHMEHWIRHIWSTGYVTYGALGRPHMGHWIYYIWSAEYTTYEALGGQWGWFVLILHFLKILMGLSANSKKTNKVSHNNDTPYSRVETIDPSLCKKTPARDCTPGGSTEYPPERC